LKTNKIRDSVDKTTAKAKLSEALEIAKSAGLTSDEIKDIFKK
jgi:DNA-binding transcriptional regulator YhcF (GntR family)